MLGELLDRVAAIEQHALVAVDVGDLRIRVLAVEVKPGSKVNMPVWA